MPKPWSRKAAPDPLVIRPGSTVKRDVYKAATAGFTGMTAFGALAVTGVVAGTAAHDKAVQDAAKAASVPPPAPAVEAQPAPKRRLHRTVIRTRVVHAASTSVARPATGGTVSSTTSSTSSLTHTSTSSTTPTVKHYAPAPAPKPAAAPAPKPAPAPAPSSGS